MKESELYIGIDLGGSNVRGIALKGAQRRLSNIYKYTFLRMKKVYDEVDKNIVQLIKNICCDYPESKLGGIGIALAAIYDRKSGCIVKWPNHIKWNGFPIIDYLNEIFQVPIILEDDANAAALGEQFAGLGKGVSNFIYFTISTGIGCGIVANGNLIVGEHGWAGEIGHIRVSKNPQITCKCGAIGCLQAIASGPAILENYFRIKHMNNIFEYPCTLADVVERAQQGETYAQKVFYQAGIAVGNVLANLIMILDSSRIIVGGGVTNAGKWIMDPIKEGINENLQGRRNIDVVKSELCDINGVIGILSKLIQCI